MKLIVNQAYENMGLRSTQLLGSVIDGNLRNTREARAWIETVVRGKAPVRRCAHVTASSATTRRRRRRTSRTRRTRKPSPRNS